jgi:hypothetical protein
VPSVQHHPPSEARTGLEVFALVGPARAAEAAGAWMAERGARRSGRRGHAAQSAAILATMSVSEQGFEPVGAVTCTFDGGVAAPVDVSVSVQDGDERTGFLGSEGEGVVTADVPGTADAAAVLTAATTGLPNGTLTDRTAGSMDAPSFTNEVDDAPMGISVFGEDADGGGGGEPDGEGANDGPGSAGADAGQPWPQDEQVEGDGASTPAAGARPRRRSERRFAVSRARSAACAARRCLAGSAASGWALR